MTDTIADVASCALDAPPLESESDSLHMPCAASDPEAGYEDLLLRNTTLPPVGADLELASGDAERDPGNCDTGTLASVSDTKHWFARAGRRRIELRVVDVDGDRAGHALIFGDGNIEDDCLVRIHSRCLFGDALEADDCDCGPELALSMDMIHAQGKGILLYLEQEGRGAGLAGKARGYQISQIEGLDTFASFERLGYDPDSRHYMDAAHTLKRLGLNRIRLLTNNPAKIAHLRDAGLVVEHVPLLTVPRSRRARGYLKAKRVYRSHALPRTWRIFQITDGLLAVGFVSAVSLAGTMVADIAVDVIGIAHHGFFSAVAALFLGRWAWARTRLLQARFRLFCFRFSTLRLDEAAVAPTIGSGASSSR